MAERAHPEDPNYRGTIYEEKLIERYSFCLPYVAGKRVLDVPCGTGWGTSLLKNCDILVGVDSVFSAVSYGKEHYCNSSFLAGFMQALPFSNDTFDVVICLEGFEHVYRSQALQFLKESQRVLKEGGLLLMTIPLRNNNKHSLNYYYKYEYELEDIQQILKNCFSIEKIDIVSGPEGREIQFIGKCEKGIEAANTIIEHCPGYTRKVVNWLNSLEEPDGYKFSHNSLITILSNCFVILTQEGLGNLQDNETFRGKWISYIQERQDPETGLFIDPLLDKYPPAEKGHDREYLLYQITYFAIQALDALGSRPLYPLIFLRPFHQQFAINEWLNHLDWSNPWLESNRTMFVLAFLIYQAEIEESPDAVDIYFKILDWLDQKQDPKTGLWGLNEGASILNAVAAAYHFIPFYEYVHRPILRMRKIVDACLSLQQKDGLFGQEDGGGACEDEDVIDLLAVITKKISYRKEEIKTALIRSFWAIWNLQNEDGGFGYSGKKPGNSYHFSSWKAMEANTALSDTWSTWFRLTALATVHTLFPYDVPDLGEWKFRRWPALGYHRIISRSNTAKEEKTNRIWIDQGLSFISPNMSQETNTIISVIIPFFNMGDYLPETLKSVLAQNTKYPYEIIVVDDGSTESYSQDLLKNLNANSIRLIHQENRGLAAARNAGIRAAKGKFICCIDSDDLYQSDFIEKTVNILIAEPEIGFVTSYYRLFDEEDETVANSSCKFPELLIENRAMVSAMFRKEAWEKVGGYDENLPAMQDWEFWISLIEIGYKAHIIPEILFFYRVRSDSMYQHTRQPNRFSGIYRQIVQKHYDTYQRLLPDVAQSFALKYAQLSDYVEEVRETKRSTSTQIIALEKEVQRQKQLIQELKSWVSEVEAARDWFHQQQIALERSTSTQIIALEKEVQQQKQLIQELKSWISEVEAARDWFHQQQIAWESNAKELNQQINELRNQKNNSLWKNFQKRSK